MKPVWYLGRGLQLLGLLVTPSAIWAAEFTRNEPLSIGVFAGGILTFAAGYFLTRIGTKL